MILICDENLGTRVPDSLNLMGRSALSFVNLGWLGLDDVLWLPLAGEIEDSLVLSCGRQIVKKPRESAAIRSNNVGIVCLTDGEQPVADKVRLVLESWSLLEELHLNTPRPFARFLTPEGELLEKFNGLRL